MMLNAPQPLIPDDIALNGRWQPGRRAVIAPDGSATWSEFDHATNRVANGLIGLGLEPGGRVGIVSLNGLAAVEFLMGTLKAGGVAVPLNLSAADEILHRMLIDAGCGIVLATSDQTSRLDPILKHLPNLLGGGAIAADPPSGASWVDYRVWAGMQSPALPTRAISSAAHCNIIYSSGTTGLPKGILHTHGGRRDWALDLALALRFHRRARALVTLGLYSNISWGPMLATMVLGGAMVVRTGFDARDFLETVERERITHVAMVPLQYQRILDHPDFAQYDLSSLESAMSCGSPLPTPIKRRLFELLPRGVTELYGLTEGIITTLEPEDAIDHLSSVGRPLPGADIRIVGDDDKEVLPGEPGEIVGRSRITMPGYWQQPDATAAAAWRDEYGRAWLRSGDIGRVDAEGFVYILDRKKDMILSGGQNIYPADIEALLTTHSQVAECAVIGVEDAQWGETPVAIVVPYPGATIAAEDIKSWLNARLGRQQRVKAVVFHDALPRNANGKILKRELRQALTFAP